LNNTDLFFICLSVLGTLRTLLRCLVPLLVVQLVTSEVPYNARFKPISVINHGVFFTPKFNLLPMQECITHTHVIQLPELPAQKTLIDVSNCTSSLACVLAEITNTQTSYVYDLLTEIYAIIPQMDLTPPPAERRGRGFLSFIGRALNFIGTGLVDEQQLNKAVGKITKGD